MTSGPPDSHIPEIQEDVAKYNLIVLLNLQIQQFLKVDPVTHRLEIDRNYLFSTSKPEDVIQAIRASLDMAKNKEGREWDELFKKARSQLEILQYNTKNRRGYPELIQELIDRYAPQKEKRFQQFNPSLQESSNFMGNSQNTSSNNTRYLLIGAVAAFILIFTLYTRYETSISFEKRGQFSEEIAYGDDSPRKQKLVWSKEPPTPREAKAKEKLQKLQSLLEDQNSKLESIAQEKDNKEIELRALKEGNHTLQNSLADLMKEVQFFRSKEKIESKEDQRSEELGRELAEVYQKLERSQLDNEVSQEEISHLKNRLGNYASALEAYEKDDAKERMLGQISELEAKNLELSQSLSSLQNANQNLQDIEENYSSALNRIEMLQTQERNTRNELKKLADDYKAQSNDYYTVKNELADTFAFLTHRDSTIDESLAQKLHAREKELISLQETLAMQAAYIAGASSANNDSHDLKTLLAEKDRLELALADREQTIQDLNHALAANSELEEYQKLKTAYQQKEDEYQNIAFQFEEMSQDYAQIKNQLNQKIEDNEKIASGLRSKLQEQIEDFQAQLRESRENHEKIREELAQKNKNLVELKKEVNAKSQDFVAMEEMILFMTEQKRDLQLRLDEKLADFKQLEEEKQQLSNRIDQLAQHCAGDDDSAEGLAVLVDLQQKKLMMSEQAISEMEEQIASLKEIESAYSVLKENIDQREQHLKETIDHQNQLIADLNNDLQDSEDEKEELSLVINSLHGDLDDLRCSLAASKDDHSKMVQMIEDQKAIAKGLSHKIQEQEEEKQELSYQIAVLEDTLEEKKQGTLAAQEDFNELLNQIADKDAALVQLNEQFQTFEEENENLGNELVLLQTNLDEKERELAAAKSEQDRLLNFIEDSKPITMSLNERIREQQQAIAELQTDLEEHEQRIAANDEEKSRLMQIIEDNKAIASNLSEKILELQDEKQAMAGQIAAYENSLEQHEQGIAANDEEKSRLMQIIEDNKALASSLSEKIFELQDEKQAMAGQIAAYENSLEQHEQGIAANDEEKARLMQIIEDNKALASSLSEKIFELQDEKQAMAGQIAAYENSLEQHEQGIAANNEEKSRLMQIIEDNKALASSLSEKILQLQDEKQAMAGQIAAYENSLEQHEQGIAANNEEKSRLMQIIEDNKALASSLSEKILQLQDEKQAMAGQIAAYENSLEQHEQGIAANDEEKSRLMQIIEDNKALASSLSEKILELQDEKQAMAGQIAAYENSLEQHEQGIAANNEEKSRLMQIIEDNKALASSLSEKILQLQDEKQAMAGQIAAYENSLEQHEQGIAANDEEKARLMQIIEDNKALASNLSEKILQLQDEKQAMAGQIAAYENSLEQHEQGIAANNEEKSRLMQTIEDNKTLASSLSEKIFDLRNEKQAMADQLAKLESSLRETEQISAVNEEEKNRLIQIIEDNKAISANLNERIREQENEKQQLNQEVALLKNELGEKEKTLISTDEDYNRLRQNIEDTKAIILGLNKKIQEQELEKQDLSFQLSSLEQTLSENQQNFSSYDESIQKMSNEIASLKQIEKEYEQFKNEAMNQQSELAKSLESTKSDITSLENKNDQLMSALDEKQQALVSSGSELQQLRQLFEDIKEDDQIKSAQLVQMEDELANTQKLLRQLRKSHETKIADYQGDVQKLSEELAAKESENNAMVKTINRLTLDHERFITELEEQKSLNNSLAQNQTGQIENYEEKIQTLYGKINSLTDQLVSLSDSRNDIESSMKQTIEELSEEKNEMREKLKRVAFQLKNVNDKFNQQKKIWQKKEMLIKQMKKRINEQREANS